MKLQRLGKHTSNVEVQNISLHGLWLYVHDKEYFLPFKEFPWFKDATLADIHNVELHHHNHLYWPSLDVDLEIDAIESPEKYPLVSRSK